MTASARALGLCFALSALCIAAGMQGGEIPKAKKTVKPAVDAKPPQKPYYVWVQFITTDSRIPKRVLVCLPSKPKKEDFDAAVEAALKQLNNGAAPMSDRVARRQ